MVPPTITPEGFASFIADLVGKKVREILSEPQQSKHYEVVRQTPTGPTKQQISIPQAMVDLTDQLTYNNQVSQQLLYAIQGLTVELQENRKIGEKIVRRNNRRKHEDEDDE